MKGRTGVIRSRVRNLLTATPTLFTGQIEQFACSARDARTAGLTVRLSACPPVLR